MMIYTAHFKFFISPNYYMKCN